MPPQGEKAYQEAIKAEDKVETTLPDGSEVIEYSEQTAVGHDNDGNPKPTTYYSEKVTRSPEGEVILERYDVRDRNSAASVTDYVPYQSSRKQYTPTPEGRERIHVESWVLSGRNQNIKRGIDKTTINGQTISEEDYTFKREEGREERKKQREIAAEKGYTEEEVKAMTPKELREAERLVLPTREDERQARILETLEKQRQFATLTESQQRAVRTLVKQGKEVRFENGQIITEKAGRKTVITAAALARVPVTAEVDVKELEREARRLKEAEKEKFIKEEELRVKEDEPRIIGKDIGPVLYPSGDFIRTEEEKVQKLRELTKRIKRTEEARGKLGIEKGLERIQEFSRFITGDRPFAAGVVSAAIGLPFYGLAVAARVPEVTLKTAALVAGITIPTTKEATIEESRRALGLAKETVKEVVTTPESLGFLLTVPLIGIGMKYVKSPIKIKTIPTKKGKVTLVKIRGKKPKPFEARILTKKRLIVIQKGKVPPPPPTAIAPVTPTVPVPYRYEPVGIFAPIGKIPPYAPPSYLKVKEKEAIVRAKEQLVEDMITGVVKPKPPVPSKIRRIYRKEIIAKRAITPLDIAPVGIFARVIPKPPRVEVEYITPKQLRKIARKEIIQPRGIEPLDITPKGIFAEVIPKPPKIEIIKRPSAKVLRKIKRKEILERRGISPLDISPRPPFVSIKEMPMYVSPKKRVQLVKVRKKEAIVRAREKTIEEVRTGFISIKEVRPSIRRAVRKEITREVKWGIEKKRMMGIKIPKPPYYFDIKRLPLPVWKITKIQKPVLRKIYPTKPKPLVSKAKPREVITPSGQVLILKKPITITKKVKVVKAKLVSKAITEAKPKYQFVESVSKGVLERYYPRKGLAARERISRILGGRVGMEKLTGLFIVPRGVMKRLGEVVGRRITPAEKVALRQIQLPVSEQARISIQRQILLQKQTPFTLLTLDTTQALESIQELTQVQERVQIQKEVTELIEVPKPPPTPPPFVPPEKVELISRIETVLKEKGYNVYVKRKQLKKGKGSYKSRGYKKANVKPLTKEGAMGLGMSITDRFTNRSFYIEKAKKKAILRRDLESKKRMLQHKFRKAKKKKSIVERTQFAIDSPEEKLGIPYEAARLRRLGLIQSKKKAKLLNLMVVKKKQQISFLKIKKSKKKGGSSIKFL